MYWLEKAEFIYPYDSIRGYYNPSSFLSIYIPIDNYNNQLYQISSIGDALKDYYQHKGNESNEEAIVVGLQKYLIAISNAFADPLAVVTEAFTAKITYRTVKY